jgi:hypothetical protein
MANRFLNNITINDSYTLPSVDGTADQLIATDGAGQLSFIDPSAISVGESEQVHIACKNTSGVAISKGDPVYITGTVGTSYRIEIAKADASDSAKMPAVGLAETDLAINAEGFVIVSGVLKNITTDPLSTGDGTPSSNDTVYVKVGGGLTRTKPTGAANLIQNVGKVGRVQSTSAGSIAVSTIMRTNDVPNLTTGKIWVGSSTYTTESTVVHLDETNGRMGIGTTSPDTELHVEGNLLVDAYNVGEDNGIFLREGFLTIDQPSITVWDMSNSGASPDGLSLNAQDGIRFRENGGEVARFKDGNFGIGITSPSEKLEVAGNIVQYPPTGTGGYLKLGQNVGANDVAIELGEGRTTSGVSRIDFIGDTTYTDYGFRAIRHNSGANATSQLVHRGTGNFELVSQDSGDIILNPNSGNVGIGTTNPLQKLDVSGSIKMTETAATSDTDKFVVSDSGVLKYRTGSQVLSDIGAQAAGTYNTIIGTDTDISYSGATVLSTMTMTDGVIQSHSSRTLTAADIGAAASSHTHDDRYYTESEIQTYFNRGYISSQSATNLAVGWYTIATNTGDRALGEFQIWETAGSRHQSVLFNASHHFGVDNSNDITVLANSRFGTDVFRYIRIKEGGTYDGAALQIYIDNATNTVNVAITGANAQTNGWVLKDWVADATDPGDLSNYSSFTEACRIDLDNTRDGGIETTGKFFAQNSIVASGINTIKAEYDSNHYMQLESNSAGGVLKGLDGGIVTTLVRSYGDSYFNGGNFGIGTTSPAYKLDVNGNAQFEDYIRITNSGGAQRILFGNQDSSGVNNPSVILGANGNTYIGGGNSWTGNGGTLDYTATFLNNGNVGIGTTSPDAPLRIDQDASATALKVTGGGAGTPIAEFVRDVGATASVRIHGSSAHPTVQMVSANNTFSLGVNNTSFQICDNDNLTANARLVIDSSGNVGIGKTNPLAKLDVNGNFRITTSTLALSSTPSWGVPTQNIIGADDNTNGATLTLMNTSSIIPAGGASGTLQFVSLADATGGGGSGYATATISALSTSTPGSGNGGGGNLIFKTAASYANVAERMRISPSGNVGIGTTSPGQKLQVEGNSWIKGIYYDTSGDAGASGQVLSSTATGTNWITLNDIYYTETEADSRFVNVTGDTMTGGLNMGGNDITFQGTDPGDLVWRDGAGSETHRVWSGTNTLNYRTNGGTTYGLWHSGNDGSGSGLDADTLDGKQPPTNFAATSQTYTTIASGGWALPTGSSIFSKSDSSGGVSDDGYWFVTGRRDVGGGYSGIYTSHNDGNAWIGYSLTNTANPTWYKLWTAGNDGSGSGLDADLLDGNHASAFASASHNHDSTYVNVAGDTMTGNLTIGSGSADNYVRSYYSDNTYTEMRGYGLQFSRNTSYIRPTADNTKTLYLGSNTAQWNTLSIDASTTTFNVNGSEKMRITSGGNVGIGTTSPTQKLDVSGTTKTTELQVNTTSTAGRATFSTAAYSKPALYIEGNSFSASATIEYGYANVGMDYKSNYGSGGTAVQFKNSSGSTVGSISSTSTATAYNTSSDYRLKENVIELTDGIERIKQLQPKRFNFIEEPEKTVDGFIAHEAQEIVPEAVTGEKDGVDWQGNPDYQGIDQAKLVPLLTAALQEAIAKIESLEERIQVLENK